MLGIVETFAETLDMRTQKTQSQTGNYSTRARISREHFTLVHHCCSLSHSVVKAQQSWDTEGRFKQTRRLQKQICHIRCDFWYRAKKCDEGKRAERKRQKKTFYTEKMCDAGKKVVGEGKFDYREWWWWWRWWVACHLRGLCLVQHFLKLLVILIIGFSAGQPSRSRHEVRRQLSDGCAHTLFTRFIHVYTHHVISYITHTSCQAIKSAASGQISQMQSAVIKH